MKTGMMNSPGVPLLEEIEFAGVHQFDFLDLTLEPPNALLGPELIPEIRECLGRWNLGLVGHTAYYLPLATPFKRIQSAVHEELIHQLDLFKSLGAEKITVHLAFSFPVRFFDFKSRLSIWTDALGPLLAHCRQNQLTLMIENTLAWQGYLDFYQALLKIFPDLRFHLDVGHANLVNPGNETGLICKKLGRKLAHVHVSDNFGGTRDLHLPLGAGNIDWPDVLRHLHRRGYDDTITLEVFSQDREYLLFSRKKLICLWNSLGRSGERLNGSKAET